MRFALVAALAVLAAPSTALAHGAGKLTGMWRVHQMIVDGKTQTFPEAFKTMDERAVWGRQLWVFEEEAITLATQVALRNREDVIDKGSKKTRDAEYMWCQAQATVPLRWVDGHDPALPSMVHIHASGARTAGKTDVSGACNLDLKLGDLVQVDNGPGAPKGASTLTNKDESFVVVLVPDGRPAELDDFVEGQNKLE